MSFIYRHYSLKAWKARLDSAFSLCDLLSRSPPLPTRATRFALCLDSYSFHEFCCYFDWGWFFYFNAIEIFCSSRTLFDLSKAWDAGKDRQLSRVLREQVCSNQNSQLAWAWVKRWVSVFARLVLPSGFHGVTGLMCWGRCSCSNLKLLASEHLGERFPGRHSCLCSAFL